MAKKETKVKDAGVNVTDRPSTFSRMIQMMKGDTPPTKNELAEMIVENSPRTDYEVGAAKKTVPVRLNHLKKRGYQIECRLHEDGKYRYHLTGKQAPVQEEAPDAVPSEA